MLDIENYDRWSEVCDDDDLIKELYDSGVRPGTDEFKELLGTPCNDGRSAGFKDFLFLIAAICLPILIAWASFKLIKFVVKKIVKFIKRKSSENEKK